MPAPTVQDRARMLLSILHLLAEKKTIPLEELATSLNVSIDGLSDDLMLLACCGVAPYDPLGLTPIVIEDGNVTMWGDLPALDKAVRLSAPEARALAAALQYAGIDPEDRLVGKLLEAGATAELESREELDRVLRTSSEDTHISEAFMATSRALVEHRVLAIEYAGSTDAEPRARAVEPVQLLCERGVWYLHAYCRDANAPRTFRVDRIVSATVTSESAPDRGLTAIGTPFTTEGLPVARLRFVDAATYDAREWPYSRVVQRDGGGLVIELPYAGTGWVARQVTAHLGGVEVVEPIEMRAAVARYARELAGGSAS